MGTGQTWYVSMATRWHAYLFSSGWRHWPSFLTDASQHFTFSFVKIPFFFHQLQHAFQMGLRLQRSTCSLISNVKQDCSQCFTVKKGFFQHSQGCFQNFPDATQVNSAHGLLFYPNRLTANNMLRVNATLSSYVHHFIGLFNCYIPSHIMPCNTFSTFDNFLAF